MNKEIKNWLDSAQYDLDTADHMVQTGRYIYTVFACHLSLEKILKAKVEEVSAKTPPKTHNLRYLIQLSGLDLPDDIHNFLSKLSDLSVPTRYPDDFNELVSSYDKETAENYLIKTRETFEWIKKSLMQ